MDENFVYGRLIASSNQPKAVVIFYPPATGDKGHQLSEANKLKEINYASLLYNPPYRIHKNQGGLADPEGEKKLWFEAKNQFPKVSQSLKEYFGSQSLKIYVVGKNLGGSVAAYSIDHSVSGIIVTGSVPILSTFWTTSLHPVALEARKGLSGEQLKNFEKQTSDLDLVKTIPQLKKKVFIQFGKNDPWIEPKQADLFSRSVPKDVLIEWTDDDHVMASEDSVAQRIKFLKEGDQY